MSESTLILTFTHNYTPWGKMYFDIQGALPTHVSCYPDLKDRSEPGGFIVRFFMPDFVDIAHAYDFDVISTMSGTYEHYKLDFDALDDVHKDIVGKVLIYYKVIFERYKDQIVEPLLRERIRVLTEERLDEKRYHLRKLQDRLYDLETEIEALERELI